MFDSRTRLQLLSLIIIFSGSSYFIKLGVLDALENRYISNGKGYTKVKTFFASSFISRY
ncbi:MAG: hypothetical protein ACJ0DD_02310 [Paracoccaceae bacterium]